MLFLASIICSMLAMTCDATPVVVTHHIAPTEFTVQSVKVATVKPIVNQLTTTKKKIVNKKVGGLFVPTYFAHVTNGIVDNVIVIDQANLNTGKWGNPSEWIKTSPDGSVGKNYAGKGFTFDGTKSAFISPKPTGDAILNATTDTWTIPQTINTFVNSTSSNQ